MEQPINPTAWLWHELADYLTADQLSELRAGYKAQSDRYSRAAKIRQIKREIATFEKIISYGSRVEHYATRIERRRAKLVELEALE